ncbi:MAG: arsenate reductase ArsC [Crocinitomicaceae bacterium]|nr:arsenate reductase ArsC [Crocinitomicaceae bacterium]
MGKNILVLCTGNSCRSQIADGYLKAFSPEGTNIYSAGVEVHGVNQKAVSTMAKDGIDISNNTSNNVDEFSTISFDYIITVCDNARERCPYFRSNAYRFHKDFPDPAKATGSEEEVNAQFDEVRDIVKVYCKSFVSAYL